MEKIVIEDLSFKYPDGDKLILKEVNLEVEQGDFVCLLGQSGCGKSTLLRLLAGLERATQGSIKIGEEVIKGADLNRSVVFQDYGLFPWMSAGDNIMLALKQKYPQKRKQELKEIAFKALDEVGLSRDVFEKYPKALSGGMKQRCAIARSFSLNPPILLMDEPFGALDAVTRAKLQELVLNLWRKDKEKKTVFFVTHDVDEALLLGTKICVLGQSPSHVIYECNIKDEKKPTRSELYEDVEIMKLRNELIKYINLDVASRIE